MVAHKIEAPVAAGASRGVADSWRLSLGTSAKTRNNRLAHCAVNGLISYAPG